MHPILELSALHILRDKTAILRGIDWRVNAGENWVILGPNGCGKTSLLRTITGYMTASRGKLSALGRTYGACDWRELRLQIGIVSSSLQTSIPAEETALETTMSGRYAQLDLWVKTTPADRKEARHWLRFLGCESFLERPWLFLSQGEKQRVLLARALMARPKLLILDEPCSGLDPVAREHFLSFLRNLAKKPKAPALVLVTHHVEEIVEGFTHALVLKNGSVVTAGPLRKALRASPLSQAFGVRMNLKKTQGRYRLTLASPLRRAE